MSKKVGEMDNTSVEGFVQGAPSFMLDENIVLNLEKLKCRDVYRLLNFKLHQSTPAGLQRWSKILPIDSASWGECFKMSYKTCKETKLREFKFKLLHRIVVTKKELKRFEIKSESDCLYCGELDSIDHTFLDCQFTSSFTRQVVGWCNATNNTSFNPEPKEIVFGLFKQCLARHEGVRKFNYTFFIHDVLHLFKQAKRELDYFI